MTAMPALAAVRPRLVVGITGASGAAYGVRLLERARDLGVETHLVVTPSGVLNVHHECGLDRRALESLAAVAHAPGEIGACIASGSFDTAAMVIAPCTMKTLAAIAHGFGDNLLTRAGELFHGQALEIIAQLNHARALLRGQQSAPPDTLNIAVPHNLALTFFPKWLTEVKRGCGEFSTRLTAGNVHDAVMALESGSCDVLLCYHHPHQPVLLDPARYDMLALGEETLRPYARRTASGQPAFSLPGSPQQPIPFLAYAAGAYLERMVALMVANGEEILHLTPCYETDMAEGLKSMVLEGHGLAFLPDSAVCGEVERGQLAVAGDARWQLNMEIRLYREHRSSKPLVNMLWQHLRESTVRRRRP